MRGNLLKNNVTPEMLAQLPFIEGELQVVMTRGKKTGLVYKLYNVTEENIKKAEKLLVGGDLPTLPKKSRVYVLPNCIYTQVQIREICKVHGFTITTDISKADLFVGNNNCIFPSMVDNEFPDGLGSYRTKLYKYAMTDDFAKAAFTTRYPDFMEPATNSDMDVYFSNYYYNNIDSWSVLYGTDESYSLLSGEAVEILHRILSGKVPVVNEEKMFNSIDRLIIDEDMFNTLQLMFNSNREDKTIACELLFNANYEKSYYRIYKLIQENYYDIESYMNRKNKEIFYKTFPAREIRSNNYEEDLNHLYKVGQLTEDAYMDILYTKAAEEIDSFTRNMGDLRKFFAVDMFISKNYDEFIESKKPKVNEENVESTTANSPF